MGPLTKWRKEKRAMLQRQIDALGSWLQTRNGPTTYTTDEVKARFIKFRNELDEFIEKYPSQ
jgi:hypothetical protein